MDWERSSRILLSAQDRLRLAIAGGSPDLAAGLEAWDRAVRSHNEWTAAASHALHAERRASEALDALEAWALDHAQSTRTPDLSVIPSTLVARDTTDVT